jgi:hypothetical protein
LDRGGMGLGMGGGVWIWGEGFGDGGEGFGDGGGREGFGDAQTRKATDPKTNDPDEPQTLDPRPTDRQADPETHSLRPSDTQSQTQTQMNPRPQTHPDPSLDPGPDLASLKQVSPRPQKRYCPNCPECTACLVHKTRDNYADAGKRCLAERCLECEYPKCDHCGFQHSRSDRAVQERHKIDGRWFCNRKACKEARVAAAKDASHMKGVQAD